MLFFIFLKKMLLKELRRKDTKKNSGLLHPLAT